MPINLSQTLPWSKIKETPAAHLDEIRTLDDLQGNILKGHGREDTLNIFFKFDPAKPAEAKTFIRSIAGLVTSAHQQLIDADNFKATGTSGGTFRAFYLSFAGYKALGLADAQIPQDAAFKAGLKTRTALLNDPPKAEWDEGLRGEIHAMLLIGEALNKLHKDEPEEAQRERSRHHLEELLAELTVSLPPSVKIVQVEKGRAMKNTAGDGIEHFGYVDGRSQPLMIDEQVSKERDEDGGITKWDPKFNLDTALVKDPSIANPNSFGSYFVFRKLEQDVRAFKLNEQLLALKLGFEGEDIESAGALVVGRFEDGTPVTVRPEAEGRSPVTNNFNYDQDDKGLRCPFQAHIRKSNPRGESVALGATLPQERAHLMARRGITYGEREDNPNPPVPIFEEMPRKDVGLLFMAYQNNIANQFEFTQQAWVNNPGFVKAGTGIDPVLGQFAGAPLPQKWPKAWGQPDGGAVSFDFHGFVTMKGGEYFFAPCLSFLKSL